MVKKGVVEYFMHIIRLRLSKTNDGSTKTFYNTNGD